jgi:gamma-glutamyltranspeptidase
MTNINPNTFTTRPEIEGTFAAWMLLLRDYGTMSLAEVLPPAPVMQQGSHPASTWIAGRPSRPLNH